MTIADLLEELDGAGLCLVDDDLINAELHALGVSRQTRIATEGYLAGLVAAAQSAAQCIKYLSPARGELATRCRSDVAALNAAVRPLLGKEARA